MGSRGQKRTDLVEDMPADKRSCSSLEFNPSSSNSSIENSVTPVQSIALMDEVLEEVTGIASQSAPGRSENDIDEDPNYGSYDSDGESDHSISRDNRPDIGNSGIFTDILSRLREEGDESGVLAALTELCELLAFSSEGSVSRLNAKSLSPVLVNLTKNESNSERTLLSVRAMTDLCDVYPRSTRYLVQNDAVPALCQRLMAIEYADVAEQCFEALERISSREPLACLQSGAITAVLCFIDFFSRSAQRVAISTVLNICEDLPSEGLSPVMEAVPMLCSLLQYDDHQIVEDIVTCLIRLTEQAQNSTDMLNELCDLGVINQTTHLISLKCKTPLSTPTYSELVGVYIKLASGSIRAVQTLFEVNISGMIMDIFSSINLSHSTTSFHVTGEYSGQSHILEVLKLLDVLLPALGGNQNVELNLEKQAFLNDHPDLFQKFKKDLLPVLIQVVNSADSLNVCYGSLHVINKFVYFSEPKMLDELLRGINISSFLAGVLNGKNQHIQVLALQIVDLLLQKLSDVFLNLFVKEGVTFAIHSLLSPESHLQSVIPVNSGIHLAKDSSANARRSVIRCFCYSFHTSLASERNTCEINKASITNLAEHIMTKYFAMSNGKGTDVLNDLKALGASLNNQNILCQIMGKLIGEESASTFELIKSGIDTGLVHYLSCDLYTKEFSQISSVEIKKRFEEFGSLFLPSEEKEAIPLSVIVEKMQNALSQVENFSLILNHQNDLRHSYTTFPNEMCKPYPCITVQFIKGEGETDLADYSDGIQTIDPFVSLDSIGCDLSPKVRLHVNKEGDVYNANHSEMQTFLKNNNNEQYNPSKSSEENGDTIPTLLFYFEGYLLYPELSLYQNILFLNVQETDGSTNLWSQIYQITYRREHKQSSCNDHHQADVSGSDNKDRMCWHYPRFFPRIFSSLIFNLDDGTVHNILVLLKILEGINDFMFHLASHQKLHEFARGRIDNMDTLRVVVSSIPMKEFVNVRLTEKLEQQMQDPMIVSEGSLPLWCFWLLDSCPFVFGFDVRSKFFRMAAFSQPLAQPQPSSNFDSRRSSLGRVHDSLVVPKKKLLVCRDRILDSANMMMDLHARQKAVVEIEFDNEIGTGLGPTLEFFTLVSREFQLCGHGMWRDDHITNLPVGDSRMLVSSYGLFPRPISSCAKTNTEFSDVIKKFFLLGQVVAKALHDGKVFDIPFSKAFYKLFLGKELTLYDIHLFDPELGRSLLEFLAIVERQKYLKSINGENFEVEESSCFRGTRIEDLCIDFTLPGYPDHFLLSPSDSPKMLNLSNLEEYVNLVVEATIGDGISEQIKAFKSGFNEVFHYRHIMIFTEDELEHLLCGEHGQWTRNVLLENIKFDHGYTATSPTIINLLDVLLEFDHEQQKSFLLFVTGAPSLPSGGLASLNPKLTIVCKKSGSFTDNWVLPSVMTCANYLKLPPYSTKEILKEKLLCAITEGQGSFHLS